MKTLYKILGCFLAVAMVIAGSAGTAYADGGRKMLVSPTESRIKLDPGQQVSGEYSVVNTGDLELTFVVSAEAMDLQMPDYASIYGEPAINSNTLLANWFSFPQTEYTLQPGETATVRYTINVPGNAPGGAQRAAVMSTMSTDGQISVDYRAAYRIFATISGDTRVDAKVTKISIPSFLLRAPLKSKISLENNGNTDEWADETMIVETLGGKEVYNLKSSHVVLAGKPRTVENRWDGAPGLGIFRVTQTAVINGTETSKTGLVFIIPLYLIVIFGLLLALLIGKIILSRRTLKRK